jgi:hypothetical protein
MVGDLSRGQLAAVRSVISLCIVVAALLLILSVVIQRRGDDRDGATEPDRGGPMPPALEPEVQKAMAARSLARARVGQAP